MHLKNKTKNYYCLNLRNIRNQQSKTNTNLNFQERERERQRETETETEREKRREKNTLLHKDKDLSTSRLFYKTVPDDKHSNTQYVKQEYK